MNRAQVEVSIIFYLFFATLIITRLSYVYEESMVITEHHQLQHLTDGRGARGADASRALEFSFYLC